MREKSRPLQIPLPGGSGAAPTGAVQFQGDWPGLFIRGDTAIGMAFSIRQIQQRLANDPDPEIMVAVHVLRTIADTIERDVKV